MRATELIDAAVPGAPPKPLTPRRDSAQTTSPASTTDSSAPIAMPRRSSTRTAAIVFLVCALSSMTTNRKSTMMAPA